MSSSCDDDDFGTFECATPALTPSGSEKVPEWLLGPQITESADTVSDVKEHSQILTAGPNPISIEENRNSKISNEDLGQEPGPHSTDDVIKTADDVTEKNLVTSSNVAKTPSSEKESEKDLKISKLEEQILAFISMKETRDESFNKICEKFSEEISQLKKNQEEERKRHKEEITRIKKKHKTEVEAMTSQWEHFTENFSRNLNMIFDSTLKDERLKHEEDLTKITENCVTLLRQQAESLQKKWNQLKDEQEKDWERIKKDQEEKVMTLVGDSELKATEKHQNFIKEYIREQLMNERIEAEKSLKDREDEMRQIFQNQLEIELKFQREKSQSQVDEAVESALHLVKDHCRSEHQRDQVTRGHHLTAVQMLLSASQEHLQKLTSIINDTTND